MVAKKLRSIIIITSIFCLVLITSCGGVPDISGKYTGIYKLKNGEESIKITLNVFQVEKQISGTLILFRPDFWDKKEIIKTSIAVSGNIDNKNKFILKGGVEQLLMSTIFVNLSGNKDGKLLKGEMMLDSNEGTFELSKDE